MLNIAQGCPVDSAAAARRGTRLLASAALLLAAACAPRPALIGAPPPSLQLDPFYTRAIDARGIAITSSAAVPDRALLVADRIVTGMLKKRPDIKATMIAQHMRVMVMGVDQQTLDVPEQRTWTKPAADDVRLTVCESKHYAERIGVLSDRDYWARRARGMGGRLTSAATENLLAIPGTRYFGETILVHEFSHAIMAAAAPADPALYARILAAYAQAHSKRLWVGEYGDITPEEYWAEGTQFWFNSNKLAVIEGEQILSSTDLARHDPALAAVLRDVYGNRHHLSGDPFYKSPARLPATVRAGGPLPRNTAERC